jgi:hypothetical protein
MKVTRAPEVYRKVTVEFETEEELREVTIGIGSAIPQGPYTGAVTVFYQRLLEMLHG